jgi:hypothetical protein
MSVSFITRPRKEGEEGIKRRRIKNNIRIRNITAESEYYSFYKEYKGVDIDLLFDLKVG